MACHLPIYARGKLSAYQNMETCGFRLRIKMKAVAKLCRRARLHVHRVRLSQPDPSDRVEFLFGFGISPSNPLSFPIARAHQPGLKPRWFRSGLISCGVPGDDPPDIVLLWLYGAAGIVHIERLRRLYLTRI